jgi:cyclic pyranopterin phosphate synthase
MIILWLRLLRAGRRFRALDSTGLSTGLNLVLEWARNSSDMDDLTHFDEHGASRMVDVSGKEPTLRRARASGRVSMLPETLRRIRDRQITKGDVLEVARLAGIMAAKQTPQLIPLCHVLPLESVEVAFSFPDAETVAIDASVQVTARTGVEMEALVAVSAAALTIYDMCKAIDRGISIDGVRLEEKSGGRSGHFKRESGRGET